MVNWASVFDEVRAEPGASSDEIEQLVAAIGQPLSEAEVEAVNLSQRNPFPGSHPLHTAYRPFDPSVWRMPRRPFPASYLAFLRWSNGGWCRSGEREFGFFPACDPDAGVRAMMLAYHLPQYMPEAWKDDFQLAIGNRDADAMLRADENIFLRKRGFLP